MIYRYSEIIWKIALVMSMWFTLVFIFNDLTEDRNKIYTGGENHVTFALDVSQSMNVRDINGDSRLVAAKKKIVTIMQENPWYDYALSIFAWESQRVLPFTQDISLFGTFLLSLDSRNLSIQGTDIQAALLSSTQNFWTDETWSIIILTDGDDEEILISQEVIKALEDKNLWVYILWVWSEQGGVIPNKIYNGRAVNVSLNTQWLKSLARKVWGKYYNIDEKIYLESRLVDNALISGSVSLLLLWALLSWLIYILMIYMQLYCKID